MTEGSYKNTEFVGDNGVHGALSKTVDTIESNVIRFIFCLKLHNFLLLLSETRQHS